MQTKTQVMNQRFAGFLNTPLLWTETLERLQMFTLKETALKQLPLIDETVHIRLGKLIEKFVLCELGQQEEIKVLHSNIQIFRNQITIGELDVLLQQMEDFVHLEIVYKFYLYDPAIPGELNRWIGPNRNDSLVHKLQKLQNKQLPLLFNNETVELLKKLNLKVEEFRQQLYFKAQLFVPFQSFVRSFPLVNNDCIRGFYIRFQELNTFDKHHFFIPSKLDWLIEPVIDVDWLSAANFKKEVSLLLEAKKAPLCWMQAPEGKLQPFFMVWWD